MKWIFFFLLNFSLIPGPGYADHEQRFKNPHTQILYDWFFAERPKYYGDISKLNDFINKHHIYDSHEFYTLPEVILAKEELEKTVGVLSSPGFLEEYIQNLKQQGLFFDYGEVARAAVMEYLQQKQSNARRYTPAEAEQAARNELMQRYGADANPRSHKKPYNKLESYYLDSEKEFKAKKKTVLSKKEHTELSAFIEKRVNDAFEKQITSLLKKTDDFLKEKVAFLGRPEFGEATLMEHYQKNKKMFRMFSHFPGELYLPKYKKALKIHKTEDLLHFYHVQGKDLNFLIDGDTTRGFIQGYLASSTEQIHLKLPSQIEDPKKLFPDLSFKDRLEIFFKYQASLMRSSYKNPMTMEHIFKKWVPLQQKYLSDPLFNPREFPPSPADLKNKKSIEAAFAPAEKIVNIEPQILNITFFNKKTFKQTLYSLKGKGINSSTFFAIIDLNHLDDSTQLSLEAEDFTKYDTKITNVLPMNSEAGIMGVPSPEGYRLKGVTLYQNKKALDLGKDFQIYYSPSQDAYYLKTENSKLFNNLSYEVVFEPAQAFPERLSLAQKPLLNLDLKKLMAIIPDLEKIGLTQLAKSFKQYVSIHEKYKIPFSTNTFSKIIAGRLNFPPPSRYSWTHEKKDIPEEMKSSLLGDFVKYADEDGKFCTQCDGSNSLTERLLNTYFGKDSKYQARTRSGYYASGNTINTKRGHRQTVIVHKNQAIQILDSTPLWRDFSFLKSSKLPNFKKLQTTDTKIHTKDALENLVTARAVLTQNWKNMNAYQKSASPLLLQEAMTYSRSLVDYSQGKMAFRELQYDIKRVHPEKDTLQLNSISDVYDTLKTRVSELKTDLENLTEQYQNQLAKTPAHEGKFNPLHDFLFLKNLKQLLESSEAFFQEYTAEDFEIQSKKNAPKNQCHSHLENIFHEVTEE